MKQAKPKKFNPFRRRYKGKQYTTEQRQGFKDFAEEAKKRAIARGIYPYGRRPTDTGNE